MSEIALIGIGMGTWRSMTVEAKEFCDNADLLIGAGRMLDAVEDGKQERVREYLPDRVAACIAGHPDAERIAILMSGDIGFYSGARKLLEKLPADVRVMPGISSVVYFCSQLQTAWDDLKLTSSHGASCNLIGEIRRNRKVFSILGKGDAAAELCRKLCFYEMENVVVHIGENLGYPEEKILTGAPSDFTDYAGTPLSVVLVENPAPFQVLTHGIPDEAFLRDKVPMTKEEVREISLSKLRLTENSVIYDVGAGSGSVSIECALQAVQGQVYAVEKNPTAVQLLHANKKKFCADNLTIVEGLAPEALEDLPVATHAFIGGSSGNMAQILELLLKKNPEIRVVVNAITLETVHEALEAFKNLPFTNEDVVSVSAAKSKQVGRYHMMMGQNPVYVISADGKRPDASAAEASFGE
ncbi:MAG: precorrin-6y C5,15-methyltransferase (decarboxylating) subunit CbiE [Eubacteriales bacterium]|nr:precorrin-6y C5,15-methyltransferase (decarboxylating) subunit CbiE [Eubacteriales bacterium]